MHYNNRPITAPPEKFNSSSKAPKKVKTAWSSEGEWSLTQIPNLIYESNFNEKGKNISSE